MHGCGAGGVMARGEANGFERGRILPDRKSRPGVTSSRRNGNRLILCVLVFCLFSGAQAQVPSDTLKTGIRRTVTPRGAVIRSAILPGWGQWYNRQRWKAAFVLGVEMGLAGSAVYFDRLAARSDNTYDKAYYQDTSSRIVWWAVGVYLLNLIDAYVDATLWDFDTGPALSAGCEDAGGVWLVAVQWKF